MSQLLLIELVQCSLVSSSRSNKISPCSLVKSLRIDDLPTIDSVLHDLALLFLIPRGYNFPTFTDRNQFINDLPNIDGVFHDFA